MGFVALFLACEYLVYVAFFLLASRLIRMGTGKDAGWAAFHRTWVGAGLTLALIVFYMAVHVSGMPVEQSRVAGKIVIWLLRAVAWVIAVRWVYRETRWRRGKLATFVLAGLALNAAIDFGMAKFATGTPLMPSFDYWDFQLC